MLYPLPKLLSRSCGLWPLVVYAGSLRTAAGRAGFLVVLIAMGLPCEDGIDEDVLGRYAYGMGT